MSKRAMLLLLAALASAVLLVPLPSSVSQEAEHHVTLEARSFAFQPAVIRVNKGDRVILDLVSADVTHGIYLDGYALEAASEPGHTARLDFVADQTGKFKYRCSIACGTMHPFMIGELVVQPNLSYWRALGLVLLAAVGSVAYLWNGSQTRQSPSNPHQPESGRRIELTRIPILKKLLQWKDLQAGLMLLTLFGFVLAILTSFFGTPVGSRNFAIVYVWIVWWALLKIVLVPLGGRVWCTVCPIPGPGEWLQRRGILARGGGKRLSLGKRWPRRLNNGWLQNVTLLGVTIFSPLILTVPLVTGIVLLAFILLAVLLSVVFERRTFCRYLCPVGGFIGLYAMVAPVELRVKDRQVCREHRAKECYWGSADGYGCPWLVQPWNLERNAHCGLCTECIKTCPKDNVAVNLRPVGSDLLVKAGRGLDEAYMALIMLASVLLFSAIFLGPWGWLKDWANAASFSGRTLYAFAFLALNVLVVPGLFLGVAALSKRLGQVHNLPLKQWFVSQSYALIPLGLAMWIAFSFSFLFVSGSYAISVLSDPFGWGWDLFGTASVPWTPVMPGVVPFLQVAVLIAGLVFSIHVALRIGRQQGATDVQALRGLIPVAAFLAAATALFLLLYLG